VGSRCGSGVQGFPPRDNQPELEVMNAPKDSIHGVHCEKLGRGALQGCLNAATRAVSAIQQHRILFYTHTRRNR
jgi:hypothetical protein